ncbi:MAG: hypothetical protein M3032_00225 [Verrucomicrobiota bacterium]|nr:hypothetical protein [Verrucomicrobiota bacterium]
MPQEPLNLRVEGELLLDGNGSVVRKTDRARTTGGDLFIVDNSDDTWKGLKYLHDWTEIASACDIATGFFEIGALLALEPGWQKLERFASCSATR